MQEVSDDSRPADTGSRAADGLTQKILGIGHENSERNGGSATVLVSQDTARVNDSISRWISQECLNRDIFKPAPANAPQSHIKMKVLGKKPVWEVGTW